MGVCSMGSIVPAPAVETETSQPRETEAAVVVVEEEDKEILCPICMQVIKDAFLTACGHSFCYTCISTHLRNRNNCPSCAHYLTLDRIFPNFLLNKILKKNSVRKSATSTSLVEHFNQILQEGCELSMRELDGLISLLAEKKRIMEQENDETNTRILLDFLHCLRKKKLEELNAIQADLQYIKDDINAIERHRIELCRAKERHMVKWRILPDDHCQLKAQPPWKGKHSSGIASGNHSSQGRMLAESLQRLKADVISQMNSQGSQRTDAYRKRQFYVQFNDLQEYYLRKRRHWARHSHRQEAGERVSVERDSYHPGLEDFQTVLSTFTRYSRLTEVAELRHANIFQSANFVSSIEFDRDDEFFATAGVSRCIKVFEFSSLVNEPSEVHCPIAEMSTRSKLICLSWNKYNKNHIASSDYEGIVMVWDVNTRQSVMEYEEHERRVWSVDFSRTEPSLLVSGSDDWKVKVWCTTQEESVINIDMRANICSVKFNPGSSMYIAVGSADHDTYYYDLRNTRQPLHVLNGQQKAVSYVNFLSNNELVSASTDSTLRLWDAKENLLLRTYKGHINERNFVGLTVNADYIACGSETNEVFVYHKAISKPMTCHKFRSSDLDGADDNVASHFISAVCWKSDNRTMLTANSQGTIKVLALAP